MNILITLSESCFEIKQRRHMFGRTQRWSYEKQWNTHFFLVEKKFSLFSIYYDIMLVQMEHHLFVAVLHCMVDNHNDLKAWSIQCIISSLSLSQIYSSSTHCQNQKAFAGFAHKPCGGQMVRVLFSAPSLHHYSLQVIAVMLLSENKVLKTCIISLYYIQQP